MASTPTGVSDKPQQGARSALYNPRELSSDSARTSALERASARTSLLIWNIGYRSKTWILSKSALAQVLILWAVTRIIAQVIFQLVSIQQRTVNPGTTGFDYLSWWDAEWYRKVWQQGYPSVIEFTPEGVAKHNAWAFYPLYSWVSGGLSSVTGLMYEACAIIISLLSSFVLAWLLYKVSLGSLRYRSTGIFDTRADAKDPQHRTALWAVVIYGTCATSPIFNTGYAESFTIAALLGVCLLLAQDRYWLAVPVALIAATSRPIGVPLGALAGLWWVYCTLRERALRVEAGQSRVWMPALLSRVSQLISALLICSFAFIQPVAAALVTGRPRAYAETEMAWTDRPADSGLDIVVQWFHQGWEYAGVAGPVLVIALFIGYALWLAHPSTRRALHPLLILWCAVYAGYLAIFWYPHTSTFRILLPLFPLALLLVSYSASRVWRWGLLAFGIYSQLVWVGWLWHRNYENDWLTP